MSGENNLPTPLLMNLEPGTYHWCACGKTGDSVFCDGSHKGSGIEPVEFNVDEAGQVPLCSCQKTGSAPFCDGSHKK